MDYLFALISALILILIKVFSRFLIRSEKVGCGEYKTHQNIQPIVSYDEIKGRLPYTPNIKTKNIIHNGQLKLFLTELQFLTNKYDPNEDTVVVYAGSAPSNKLPFLSEMFPQIKWILVDPNIHYLRFNKEDLPAEACPHSAAPLDQYSENQIDKLLYMRISPMYESNKADIGQRVKGNKELNLYDNGAINRVSRNDERQGAIPDDLQAVIDLDYTYFIIEDFFSDDIASSLNKLRQKCLFISDIRTNPDKESPSTIDILWNSAMMYNWLKILKPDWFMIKFRCPFPATDAEKKELLLEYNEREYTHADFEKCDIPFIENLKVDKFEFIKADIMLQAFAPTSSAESRLVGNALDRIIYDIGEYEEKFFYFNTIMRPKHVYRAFINREVGIDNCHDCALMCEIFREYYEKFGNSSIDIEKRVIERIRALLESIGRKLIMRDQHGAHPNYQ